MKVFQQCGAALSLGSIVWSGSQQCCFIHTRGKILCDLSVYCWICPLYTLKVRALRILPARVNTALPHMISSHLISQGSREKQKITVMHIYLDCLFHNLPCGLHWITFERMPFSLTSVNINILILIHKQYTGLIHSVALLMSRWAGLVSPPVPHSLGWAPTSSLSSICHKVAQISPKLPSCLLWKIFIV